MTYLCAQYSITEVWSVPYVGTVVNGIVNAGSIKTGDAVLLGPDANGNYQSIVVRSIQRKRLVLDLTLGDALNQIFLPGLMFHTQRQGNVFPLRLSAYDELKLEKGWYL